MKRISIFFAVFTICACLAISHAAAQTVKTLYTWPGGLGGNPVGNLIFDSAGNLYGTTSDPDGSGVFELTPNSGGSWIFNFLWISSGSGSDPNSIRPGVVFDASGNIYATSYLGGANGCGTVFQLQHNPDGSWSENNLLDFDCGDNGANPVTGVTFDTAGNLYGGTTAGGDFGYGVVFQLTPNSDGSWTENVLHQFTGGKDGASTGHEHLIFDASGNLYGTATYGGIQGDCLTTNGTCGTVFEMSPQAGNQWAYTVLHTFTGGTDGGGPQSTLIFDKSGNLYGTTYSNGQYGFGVVFELIPHVNGKWGEKVLHSFKGGGDGAYPIGGVILDAAGNIYGPTRFGGNDQCGLAGNPIGCGIVYELSSNSHGGIMETVLTRFHGNPNDTPTNDLLMDSLGNLYGSAAGFGTDANGSIFEVLH